MRKPAPKQTAASILADLAMRAAEQSKRLADFSSELYRLDPDKATLFDLATIADRHGFQVEPMLLQHLPSKKNGKRARR